MNVKNKAILLLHRCLHKTKRDLKAQKRYLVVSTTALGDTVWATPAIKALRHTHPDAYIAVLTSPIGKGVLELNPHIDELFVINPKALCRSLIKIFFSLKSKRIDTIFIFHISQRALMPLCSLLRPRQIIGSQGINKGLDPILTKALPLRSQHEVDRRLDMVREVGAFSLDTSLELFIAKDDIDGASAFLRKHNVASYIPLVGLHPGAKDAFKQWSKENFVTLGQHLVQGLGCQIIVTGGRDERELVQFIASKIPGAIALVEQLPLRTFAALIKKMNLFICNDTGPMHVAFSMKTPTVALFTPTDARLCGPYFASFVKVIQKQKTCTPCVRKKCRTPFCLLQISPEEVYDAAMSLFHQNKDFFNDEKYC